MLKRFFLGIVCVLFSLNICGCIFLAAGAAGAGTAKWLSEKVGEEIDAPKDKVAQAAKDAMKGMKLDVYKETKAPEVTQLLAKYSDGRQVWVDVRIVAANNSRVEVRVGWMNGEADARQILTQIVKKAKGWF